MLVAPLMLPLILASLLSCRDSQAPVPAGETVLMGALGQFALVGGSPARVADRYGPVPTSILADARSPDSATIYVTGVDEGGQNPRLVAFDTRARRVRWVEPIAPAAPRLVTGIEVGGGPLAVSPDGTRLFVGTSRRQRDGVVGIASLDVRTRQPVAFAGPFFLELDVMATLPPGPVAPGGAVLVAGSHTDATAPRRDRLYLLDPMTLGVMDSAEVVPPANDYRPLFSQVLPAADGRHVYLIGRTTLYRYDLLARQVTATAPRPSSGTLALAPDGERLYMTDRGSFPEFPGSGLLFVFGKNLEVFEPIDLRGARVGGITPVTQQAVVGRDGTRVYVTAGTGLPLALYGTQPGRVLIVDPVRRILVDTVLVSAYATRVIYVR